MDVERNCKESETTGSKKKNDVGTSSISPKVAEISQVEKSKQKDQNGNTSWIKANGRSEISIS